MTPIHQRYQKGRFHRPFLLGGPSRQVGVGPVVSPRLVHRRLALTKVRFFAAYVSSCFHRVRKMAGALIRQATAAPHVWTPCGANVAKFGPPNRSVGSNNEFDAA